MKRFFYIERPDLSDRGYNMSVVVYEDKDGEFPREIGADYKISTASWKGSKSVAANIVSNVYGYEMKPGGYHILSDDIYIQQL